MVHKLIGYGTEQIVFLQSEIMLAQKAMDKKPLKVFFIIFYSPHATPILLVIGMESQTFCCEVVGYKHWDKPGRASKSILR